METLTGIRGLINEIEQVGFILGDDVVSLQRDSARGLTIAEAEIKSKQEVAAQLYKTRAMLQNLEQRTLQWCVTVLDVGEINTPGGEKRK